MTDVIGIVDKLDILADKLACIGLAVDPTGKMNEENWRPYCGMQEILREIEDEIRAVSNMIHGGTKVTAA